MICFAFDCDLTLACARGPIPVDLLYEIMSGGDAVYMVSASPNCNIPDIPRYSPVLMPRWKVLQNLKSSVAVDRYVYVGDMMTDYDAAVAASWEFVFACEFETWFKR